MSKIRQIAVDILEEIEQEGGYSNLTLNRWMEEKQVSFQDRGLLTEMVYGTLQRKLTLDFYLNHFLKHPKKLQSWVRNLLRISLYQMLYLDRIPDHAIVNEAVVIAKKRGHQGIARMVNGVLRTIQREGVPSVETLEDETEQISIAYSLPKWLVESLSKQYGKDSTIQLAQSLLTTPHQSVRVQHLTKKDQIISRLQEEGYDVVESRVSPYGLRIKNGAVSQSQAFRYGQLTIQDESSMLVAPSGKIEANHRILDTCAAPGGKTTHMASFISQEKDGKIVALDMYEHKLKLIQENARRLEVASVIDGRVMDARNAGKVFAKESFDRIFVDAPCSGLGLMRRKPDIKYKKNASDLEELHRIQVQLLDSVAPLLKTGGYLIYSTCTLLSNENDETVEQFLTLHPNFERDALTELAYLSKSYQKNGTVQLLPSDYETDGFYICRLKKLSN